MSRGMDIWMIREMISSWGMEWNGREGDVVMLNKNIVWNVLVHAIEQPPYYKVYTVYADEEQGAVHKVRLLLDESCHTCEIEEVDQTELDGLDPEVREVLTREAIWVSGKIFYGDDGV